MSTAPPFILTREQATRLQAYIQTYRRYTLANLAPSAERNTNQRVLQTLQGKLISEMDQPQVTLCFPLTSEETKAMKTMVVDLLALTTREPASEKRNSTLLDLVELKSVVGRFYGLCHNTWRSL